MASSPHPPILLLPISPTPLFPFSPPPLLPPEWLADYDKNKLGNQRKTSQGFWKEVETKIAEKEASPQIERLSSSREKMRRKEEKWEVVKSRVCK